ncbi:MAG: DNA repair protein RadA [Chloracidobacterium sp.]|nr:DNA repair protein RadA [Chloracidobacterium sp.]
MASKGSRTVYACQSCGYQSRKWLGKCPDCGGWNTFTEERERAAPKDGASAARIGLRLLESKPVPFNEIETQDDSREVTGIEEFDRVLGGGIVPGSLVLIGGEPGIGKCLVGSTRVFDPVSGALSEITAYANAPRPALSLDMATRRLTPQRDVRFLDQGLQTVLEVATRLGRRLRCTPSHPMLTPGGWLAAQELRPGTRVAAPLALPYFGQEAMSESEIKLIAYLLSDSSAQGQISLRATISEIGDDSSDMPNELSMDPRVYGRGNNEAQERRFTRPWAKRVWDRHEFTDAAPTDLSSVRMDITALQGREITEHTPQVARFLESWGSRFTNEGRKAAPDCVFQLPRRQMALFLNALFSYNGSVYVNAKEQVGVSYITTSRRLAEDVQHLLLRFGYITRLRSKRQRINGLASEVWEAQLLGAGAVKRFLAEIGVGGCGKLSMMNEATPSSTHFNTIPPAPFFRRRSPASARDRRIAHDGVGLRPARTYPQRLAFSDIYWDEIESVTPAGEERVYDLSAPPHSNFVANDLIVHNSTLLSQVADRLCSLYGGVLYVSGEESERQIKLRGERLGINPAGLYLLSETNLERVFDEINKLQPQAIIIDSVQTIFSEKLESAPGSVSQVREVAGQFLLLAKNLTVPVFLIGHVTKEGMIAGPKALEHIVDTVLYFEGERHHNHRILRAAKNRFGAANELGIFEMTGAGLIGAPNPSEIFLSERPVGASGSAVIAALEGTRPMLVEIQALVSSSKFGTGRRTTQGVELNRVALLVAMLEKRVGFQLSGDDIFVNLVGGISLDEPAVDLGIVAAVTSSFRNIPINEHTVVFGEVGLAGEIRATNHAAVRLREVARMGFKRVVLPKNNLSGLPEDDRLEVIGVRSVSDALDALF